MITALEIQNFKCFSELRIRLGPLTLLTGFNASGKSTAIQPLLLLSQALKNASSDGDFPLNGTLVHLGTVGDIIPSRGKRASISFGIEGFGQHASWRFQAKAGERFLQLSKPRSHAAANPTISDSLANLAYLSAVRGGTSEAYPMPEVAGENQNSDVGIDGKFAPYWYDRFVDDEVIEARRFPDEPATSLRKQLDAWLGALFPGAQANVQLIPQISLLCLQFRLSGVGDWRRPANVGYGLSYAFPILVALLTASERQAVVIDSPEAHLHPSAQSEMGRLLAHFANAGVQIVVETHSDHLLNGARLAVKEGRIRNSDVNLYFFTGCTDEGHGVSSPTIDSKGRINEWPRGFFDQAERDLAHLTGW